VRIATHPDVQKMGYGLRCVELLTSYFRGDIAVGHVDPASGKYGGEGVGVASDKEKKKKKKAKEEEESSIAATKSLQDDVIVPRKELPPLLTAIADRPAEMLHYIGASLFLSLAPSF
jgi:N-acetyltransferase 10